MKIKKIDLALKRNANVSLDIMFQCMIIYDVLFTDGNAFFFLMVFIIYINPKRQSKSKCISIRNILIVSI